MNFNNAMATKEAEHPEITLNVHNVSAIKWYLTSRSLMATAGSGRCPLGCVVQEGAHWGVLFSKVPIGVCCSVRCPLGCVVHEREKVTTDNFLREGACLYQLVKCTGILKRNKLLFEIDS